MKKIFMACLLAVVGMTLYAQEAVKSYFCAEIYSFAGGQRISQVPTNQANVVWWWEDGTVTMGDGTKWKEISRDNQGNVHYSYAGSQGMIMPNTSYSELIVNANKTVLQVNYSFGLGGMMMPMVSIYRFIGNGTAPAEEWGRNGQF